jgi:glycine betaine/proline transport system substrate-binding protein
MSKTIRLGHIALSFHEATAAVVQLILEKGGHHVVPSAAPHAEMFERFRRGDVDGVVSAWLPASHGVYLAPFERDVVKLGVLYSPYCIWGVPDYVPQAIVASVDDLRKPEATGRMNKRIQGINPGAGISRFSKQMISDYRLDEHGYHFEPGTEADCFGTFEEGVRNDDWLVVPLWHPQWLHHRYRIRALEEPKGILGGTDQATLVISRDLAGKLPPDLLSQLRTLSLGNAAVTALDFAICAEGRSPRQAAMAYLAASSFSTASVCQREPSPR